MVNCPITNSTNVTLIEKISTTEIERLYNLLGVETKDTFNDSRFVFKYKSVDTGYKFYYPFTIQGTSELYEKLEKSDWYYQKEKWEHIRSLQLIDPSDHVLEIGCGQGSFLSSVKNKYGGDPIGLELNQNAADKALSLGLKVYTEELANFSLDNREAFDVICLFQVLEHIAQPTGFLRKASSMLKAGGRLIICVPDNDALINKDKENALNLPPHHMGMWNRQSLIFLGRVLQMKVELVENEPLQMYHAEWYVRNLLKKIVGKWIYYRIISKTNIPLYLINKVRMKASRINGHSILAVYKK